jgi:hypothetical protein
MLGSPQGGLIGNLMRGVAQGHATQVARHKARVDRAQLALQAESNKLAQNRLNLERLRLEQRARESQRDAAIKLEELSTRKEMAGKELNQKETEMVIDLMEGRADRAQMEEHSKRLLEGKKIAAAARKSGASKRTPVSKKTSVGADVHNYIVDTWKLYNFDDSMHTNRGAKPSKSQMENKKVLDLLARETGRIVSSMQKEHDFGMKAGVIPETMFDSVDAATKAQNFMLEQLTNMGGLAQDDKGRWTPDNERIVQILDALRKSEGTF